MFHVGDRVECLVNHPGANSVLVAGSLGVVCEDRGYTVGVRWDDDVFGNDCCGTCERGHGWWMSPREIDLYDGSFCEGPSEFDEGALSDLLFGA